LLKGLVNKFVIAYGPWVSMWEDELLQEGQIGLMKALDAYDPERGTFVTIAWLKVHTEMTRKLKAIRKIKRHEVYLEDLKKDFNADNEEVAWEETFEGSCINYQALVWHFTNWRDRRAAVCIFEQFSKKKRRLILKETMEESDERCERVFSEIMTLVGLWYGGVECSPLSLKEYKAMKSTKHFNKKRKEKNNG